MSQLVTEADYQSVTGDKTAATCDVNDALVRAQARVEQWCNRPLSYGQYQETCYVYGDGLVYPTVTPLISADSPSNVTVQGNGIYLGYLVPGPAVLAGGWSSAFPPQAQVTYTAGWTAQTLPDALRSAICKIAFRKLHPVPLVGVPAGVNSAGIGDARLTAQGAIDGFADIDQSTASDLKGWVKRQVRAWQSTPVLVAAPIADFPVLSPVTQSALNAVQAQLSAVQSQLAQTQETAEMAYQQNTAASAQISAIKQAVLTTTTSVSTAAVTAAFGTMYEIASGAPAAVTVTLPAAPASGFGHIGIKCLAGYTGTVTVTGTANSMTVDGANTFTLSGASGNAQENLFDVFQGQTNYDVG